MKHIRKRVWGTLLCLAMLLSLLPTVALASGTTSCPGGDSCTHEAMVTVGNTITHYDTIGEALQEAGKQGGTGGTVTLLKDATMEVDNTDQKPIWNTMTLDLGGHTLQYGGSNGFVVAAGVEFTLQNGTYKNTSTNYPVGIQPSKNPPNPEPDTDPDTIEGCTVNILNAEVEAAYACVYMQGYTKLYVEKSTLISKDTDAILGLGPSNIVEVNEANITGGRYGINQKPYDENLCKGFPISTYDIKNSTISGGSIGICISSNKGIAADNHQLTVEDCTITGDNGIAVQGTDVEILGSDTLVDTPNGFALAVLHNGDEDEGVSEGAVGAVTIKAGTFNGAVIIQKPAGIAQNEATLDITGGVFSPAPDTDYLGDDSYLVTVDSDNGTAATNTVVSDGSFTLPVAPTKADYVFVGWLSSTDNVVYDAEKTVPISQSVIFTAQWVPSHYTVTFNSNGGSAVAAQTVAYNQKAAEPSPAPVQNGYAFQGWYTDAACTQTYDFNTPVTGNLTLYAGWEIIVNPIPAYAISVATDGNGTVSVNPTAAKGGETVTITATPEDGYELASLAVTDFFGNQVDISRNSDGAYSFTMPYSQVEVSAAFTPLALPFADVDEGDWFHDEVAYVWAHGLMDGVADDRFHPEGTASRAMVWAILARMDGETVTGEGWAEAARAWAMETGVSDGEDGGAPVTREQLAAMLYRYAARKGWDVTERADLSAFADGDDVSPWALDALAWASAAGIVEGSAPATLEPQGEAVRAQLAAMLARFCENVAEV